MMTSLVSLGLQHRFGQLIDTISSKSEVLVQSCTVILCFFAFLSALAFFKYYFLETAADRVRNRIRVRFFSCMLIQPMTFFDHYGSAGLINRLSDDANLLADTTTKQLAQGLGEIFTVIVFTYQMITLSRSLSIVAFCIFIPLAGLTLLLGLGLRYLRAEVQSRIANSMQVAHERISAVSTVRAFCKESEEISHFSTECDKVLAISWKSTLVHAFFHSAMDLSNGVMIVGVMYWGGRLLYQSHISPGTLITFLLYARVVGKAMKGVSFFYTSLVKGMSASERIQEVIETLPGKGGQETDVGEGTRTLDTVEGNIRFHSVSFAYADNPVLSEINLDIPAGGIFAVFGASGAGKTTLARLLLRLYDVKDGEGTIKLDGVNIRSLEPEWLRRQIGYVSQDPVLFSGSIRTNILYGMASGTNIPADQLDSLLYKAAKDANALEFILRLPDKFETLVGERGELLSGGQRQRIAIARALIKNPKILLFDEATSACDLENERLIQEALDGIGKNRTVIIIAHRMSSIKIAAKIAVIEDGKSAEVGSYQNLMAIPFGKFKRLVDGPGT
ncbi:ATP-binding cassette sub-family B member 10, mitochondrial [Folsomia candida]|nr:ATP-binding cassette sub-family B member 10, mitochondrial [Folsomia candida]